MSPVGPYSDIEKSLVGWLQSQLAGGVRVLTELPGELAQVLPVVRVTRLGGPELAPRLEAADIDIDTFGGNRSQAFTVLENVRVAMRFKLPGTQLAGSVYTRVDTLSGPAWRPYENTNVRRYGATFHVIVHHVSS